MSDDPEVELECTYANILLHSGEALCEFVKEVCSEKEVIPLYYFKYCLLPQTGFGTILFYVSCFTLCLIAFYLLGRIASTYLTPVLTKVSLALNLSETVSGVTLLAFANGAPDIIASYSAGGLEGGIYITIGNLWGAGLFCSTLVVARCIQVSKKPIQMEADHWNRDLVFYCLTSLLLIVYGAFEFINAWMAAVFLIIYLVYITVVLYQDKISRQEQAKRELEPDTFEAKHDKDKKKLQEKLNKLLNNEDVPESLTNSLIDPTTIGEENKGTKAKPKRLTLTMAEVKAIYNHEHEVVAENKDAENVNHAEKILGFVTLPLSVIPALTIPDLNEEGVKSAIMPFMPWTATLMCILIKSEFDITVTYFGINAYLVGTVFALPFCLGIYFLQKEGNKNYEWILVPFALVASIMWLKTAAGTIVDMIAFTSTIFGINKVLLGATVLGIGNSLADFFANSSLSALGYGVMACTGSISGQLFNVLISLPLNVFNSLKSNKIDREPFELLNLDVDRDTKIFAMLIIFLVVGQLILLLFVSIGNNYVLNLKLAKINLAIYIICYVIFFALAIFLR